jgi:hypothetical protein
MNEKYESTKVDDNVVKYNLFQLFIEKSINLLKENGYEALWIPFHLLKLEDR